MEVLLYILLSLLIFAILQQLMSNRKEGKKLPLQFKNIKRIGESITGYKCGVKEVLKYPV